MSDLFSQTDVLGHLRCALVGFGGAGCQMVARVQGLSCFKKVLVDCDARALEALPSEAGATKCLIGEAVTRGLSCGGDIQVGAQVALSGQANLSFTLKDHDWIIFVGSLAGGFAGGALPGIVDCVEKEGPLTLVFGALPFTFEGTSKNQRAGEIFEELRRRADGVIGLPNALLMQEISETATVAQAFELADRWLGRALKSLEALILEQAAVRVDFMTLKKTLRSGGGHMLYGLGESSSLDTAVENMLLCPLLHTAQSARRATRLMVCVRCTALPAMSDIERSLGRLATHFGSKEEVLWGLAVLPTAEPAKPWFELSLFGATAQAGAPVLKKNAQSGEIVTVPRTHSIGMNPRAVKKSAKTPSSQEEFSFFESQQDQRGAFQKTSSNWFDGEDLDVPTYYRKGLKIRL